MLGWRGIAECRARDLWVCGGHAKSCDAGGFDLPPGDDCNVGPVDVAEGAAAWVVNPVGSDLSVVETPWFGCAEKFDGSASGDVEGDPQRSVVLDGWVMLPSSFRVGV